MKKKIKLSFLEIIILVALPCLILSIVSGSLVYSRVRNNLEIKTTNNKHINEFINTYNKLLDEYYEDLDEAKLIDAAIGGMLSYTGDDYTIHMNEDATDALNEKLEGEYEGIGVRISMNETGEIYMYEVFDNSPAKEAGILVNDVLISINGESVEGKDTEYASSIIKKATDPKITLVLKRNEETLSFTVERKKLVVPAIKSSIKEVNGKKIGYLYLETFSSTLDTQVKTTLISMENEGINSLIIDLRNNTGGYLTTCTNLVEMFLKKDKLMYSIKSKTESTDYKDTTDEHRTYPIVVIINEQSASASEILASALKYSYGATIVGKTSYGKGKVQTTGKLEDGTMIKYTSARWFTANGDCIDEVGLKPDKEVELSEEYLNDRIEEKDDQLNEAINILAN